MIMPELIDISLKDSLLFSNYFPDEMKLLEHINTCITNKETGILAVQFSEQLLSLDNVGFCLYMLSWIPAFMKGAGYRAKNPLKFIAAKAQQDWCLEALGRLIPLFDIYNFIVMRMSDRLPVRQTLVKDKVKSSKTELRKDHRNKHRTVGKDHLIQHVVNKVPRKKDYWEEVQIPKRVKIESVGNIHYTEIDKIIKKIKRLEIYNIIGEVKAVEFGSGEITTA